MLPLQPIQDSFAELARESKDLLRISGRGGPCPLVVADVPLPTDCIESVDKVLAETDREAKRPDCTLVSALTLSAVSRGCQGKNGKLENRVVRDAEAPVRTEAVKAGILEISLDHSQQIGDLLRARLVPMQLAISLPVPQDHAHSQRA